MRVQEMNTYARRNAVLSVVGILLAWLLQVT